MPSKTVTTINVPRPPVEGTASHPKIPGVFLFRAKEAGVNIDRRRAITDAVVEFGVGDGLPLSVAIEMSRIVQLKTVHMSKEAVDAKLAVGNHYHTLQSNRHELFVAAGPEGVALFCMRFALPADVYTLGEAWLRNGDACMILPGAAHAFIAITEGATLVGLSNLAYNSRDDVPCKLFE